jgi:hypothetical protein
VHLISSVAACVTCGSVLGMPVTSDVFRDQKYSFQSTNVVHNSTWIFIINHHHF